MVYGQATIHEDPDATHLIQEVVKIELMAMTLKKPVLLSSKFNMHAIERQIRSALFHTLGHMPALVTCKPSTTLDTLCRDLAQSPGGIILIMRVHLLPDQLQLALARVITLKKVTVDGIERATPDTIILSGERDRMLRRLCNRILICQTVTIDSETRYVVPNQDAFRNIIDNLQNLNRRISQVVVSQEIARYMRDIVIFARTHRLVRVGLHPSTMPDLQQVARLLCVFSSQDFLTPETVAEAARLVLPLRIELCSPFDEPSMTYGGNITSIQHWMSQWDSELIVESVLETVPVPV